MGVQLLLLAIVRGSTFRLRCDACQVAEEEAEAEAEAATLEVSFATHCRIVATSSACGIKCKYPCRTMLQLQSPLAECSTCAARQRQSERERERQRECCQLARLCDGGAGNEYVLNICRVKHKDDSAATHSSAAPPSSSYCPLNGFGSQSHIRIFSYAAATHATCLQFVYRIEYSSLYLCTYLSCMCMSLRVCV